MGQNFFKLSNTRNVFFNTWVTSPHKVFFITIWSLSNTPNCLAHSWNYFHSLMQTNFRYILKFITLEVYSENIKWNRVSQFLIKVKNHSQDVVKMANLIQISDLGSHGNSITREQLLLFLHICNLYWKSKDIFCISCA